jgi:hypothetical protein
MFKIRLFKCRNGNPIAIDTKKYRYWITDYKVEKIPIYQVCDKFGWEFSPEEKEQRNGEIKVLKFKYFWRGFIYSR